MVGSGILGRSSSGTSLIPWFAYEGWMATALGIFLVTALITRSHVFFCPNFCRTANDTGMQLQAMPIFNSAALHDMTPRVSYYLFKYSTGVMRGTYAAARIPEPIQVGSVDPMKLKRYIVTAIAHAQALYLLL